MTCFSCTGKAKHEANAENGRNTDLNHVDNIVAEPILSGLRRCSQKALEYVSQESCKHDNGCARCVHLSNEAGR